MSVTHVTNATFKSEVVEAGIPVVIDLWAPWCGPCKRLAPMLDELADEYEGKVKVVKVNVDEEKELAQVFQAKSIPMLVAMNGKAIAGVMVGLQPRAKVVQLFQKARTKPGS